MLCGLVTAGAAEMPPKAAGYHEALRKRPESATLFERFREAWLEELPAEELEKELLARAEAGRAGAWAVLGRARLAAANEEGALAAFEKARAAAPGAWLSMEIGRLKLAAKDFEGAEKEALAVPADDRLRPDALKLAGLACLRGGRIEEAQGHWERAVAAAPGDKALFEDLTELTRREGRLDLALEYCGKWRDAVGDDAYARALATLAMAELLEASQRHDEAMAELGAVLKVSGDGSWLEREALSRVERAFRQRGNLTARAEWLGGLAAAHPARMNFHRARAQALSEAGKTGEALEVLTAVLKRLPGDRDARWQRIGLLERDLKLEQAYDECAALAAEEKSEEAGLRLAELAFRLGRTEQVKTALDEVLAAADPAKRPALAGLYARYGMAEESEKQWRAAAAGEQGGPALRELAKFLRSERRDKEAIAVWKEIGARDSASDRMEAARMLAGAGERQAARELLESGREKHGARPGYEEARAELALLDDRKDEALAIYRALAAKAERPDEMSVAWRGWLSAAAGREEELVAALGDSPGERCLRMAWLARGGKPLPEGEGELERAVRLALLKENGRWAEAVAMMEARPAGGPLYFRELAEAKEAAGDAAGALAAVRSWREGSPDQAGPWVKEANLLEKAGDSDAAERLLRRAVARFEDDSDAPRRLFSLLEKKGEIGMALELAWQRHDRTEDSSARAGWLREIIRVSREDERQEELKARFEERARRDPASPGPQRALAELAKVRGDSRAEMEHLRKALDAAPRDAELIAALASIEERSGQTESALGRYEALAKLVPGTDSAMKLAQAKIRCGDIEGGMRDLQMLAGDQGLDLREVEASAGSLALSGRMDEAIRMLESVDAARYDARLHFMAGFFHETAGRDEEALKHYASLMSEPADPAEKRLKEEQGMKDPGPLTYLMQRETDSTKVPGFIRSFAMPDSLIEAKHVAAPRILKMVLQGDDPRWDRAVEMFPDLKVATAEQWRQAWNHQNEDVDQGSEGALGRFIMAYPDHRLSPLIVREQGPMYGHGPEQWSALLDRADPLSPEVALMARLGVQRPVEETAAWLRSVPPAVWRDAFMASQAILLIQRTTLTPGANGEESLPRAVGEWSVVLDALEGADFPANSRAELLALKARRDLEKGDLDGFVKWSNEGSAAVRRAGFSPSGRLNPLLAPAVLKRLREMKEEEREALLARLSSAALRVQLAQFTDKDGGKARIAKELATLPADAVKERRDLIRLSWRIGGRGLSNEDRRKVSLDDSDPVLAIEALLGSFREEGEGGHQVLKRAESLLGMLRASGEKEAALFYERYFRSPVAAATPTRWGTSRPFQAVQVRYRNPREVLESLSAIQDRAQQLREAGSFLEDAMLQQARGEGSQEPLFRELKQAGLLDDALSAIRLPERAGLGRRVAAMMLFDAAGRKDLALEMAEDLHRLWPRELRWKVLLALRTEDRKRGWDLLSEAAGDPGFVQALHEAVAPLNRRDSDLVADLKRLADWAEGPGRDGSTEWVGLMAASMVRGSAPWLATPQDAAKEPPLNAEKRAVFGRLRDLGLSRPESAEAVFRTLYVARIAIEPGALHEAARASLRSGAYVLGDRTWFPRATILRGWAPEAPSALEHLVLVAAAEGDDVAFPTAFREALAEVDPSTGEWLDSLLETGSAVDLPDVRNFAAMARPRAWTAMARHEAAMLRAVRMNGRDELLEKMFEEQQVGKVSRNVGHVLAASLSEAADFRVRLQALLEAAAGPRKGWAALEPKAEQKLLNAIQIIQQHLRLQNGSVLRVGMTMALTDWKLATNDYSMPSTVGSAWRADWLGKRFATRGELPGWKTADALKLGYWKVGFITNGKKVLQFTWSAPEMVRQFREGLQGEAWSSVLKEVTGNPKAPLMDLLLVAGDSGEMRKELMKRALRNSAPELAKAPPEIREVVVNQLGKDLSEEDFNDLPKEFARMLRTRADEERARRIELAVRFRDSIKAPVADRQSFSSQVGTMVGSVIQEDRKLAEEIAAKWLEVSGSKDGGLPGTSEAEFFMSGIFRGRRFEIPAIFASLELARELGLGGVATTRGMDPCSLGWQALGTNPSSQPAVWKGLAGLPPDFQVKLLAAARNDFRQRVGVDPVRAEAMRKAADGSALTRAACAWYLALNGSGEADPQGIDAKLEVTWLEAMKAAGAGPDVMRLLVLDSLGLLRRLDDPGVLLAAVPGWLEGVKSLTQEETVRVCSSLVKTGNVVPGADRRGPKSYPAEAGAVLGLMFERGSVSRMGPYLNRDVSKLVIALDEPELTERWIKAAGESLAGDVGLMLGLLRQGQPERAVLLVPPPGRAWPGMEALFAKETERLVASLAPLGTPAAFRLAVHLSMRRDAGGEEAPAESLSRRRVRLAKEFGDRAKSMSAEERRSLCAALGLYMFAAAGPVAALDEFLGEDPEAEFRQCFTVKPGDDNNRHGRSMVLLGAACSAFHRGDPRGIDAFSAALEGTATHLSDRELRNSLYLLWLPLLRSAVWMHADRHDGVMPEATAKSVRRMVSVIRKLDQVRVAGEAWSMVLLASPDAAALERNLKEAGLEQERTDDSNHPFPADFDETIRWKIGLAKLRMSVLHPAATPEFTAGIGMPEEMMGKPDGALELLADAKLRAGLPPARFLEWLREAGEPSPESMKLAATYANERRDDFDPSQWRVWGGWQAKSD